MFTAGCLLYLLALVEVQALSDPNTEELSA